MSRIGKRCGVVAGVLLVAWGAARAQYEEPRPYQQTELRALSLGLSSIQFQPKASSSGDSTAIRVHALMPVADFRDGLMDIYFGYTRFSQEGENLPAILVGFNVGTEIPMLGERRSALVLPVLIAADFTRADASGATRNSFNVASLGLGLGLKYRLVTEDVDASLSAVAVAHYATEGFSVNTGFSGAFLAEFTAYFPQVPIGQGIFIGYKFRFQSWSMPDMPVNYRMILHGPSLGIAF